VVRLLVLLETSERHPLFGDKPAWRAGVGPPEPAAYTVVALKASAKSLSSGGAMTSRKRSPLRRSSSVVMAWSVAFIRPSSITHQRPRWRRSGASYWLPSFRRSSSGSLPKFAAIRRASSLVSSLAAATVSVPLEIDVGQRLPVGVADDEAFGMLVDHPRGEKRRGEGMDRSEWVVFHLMRQFQRFDAGSKRLPEFIDPLNQP
jgi:hypothetical protein